jgi:hypothetical protein
MINLVDPPIGHQAVVEASEVQDLKLVRGARFVDRVLDVNPPYPVTPIYQVFHQMVADKAARPGNEYALRHGVSLSVFLS